MIKLYDNHVVVLNNARIALPENLEGFEEIRQNAFENTITHKILKAHNRSTDMLNLNLQFDSMGVYDNTYVGILQTARASGLKEFPIPCVFTNCHNCLGAVGGTLNADVHKYGYSACVKYGGIYVPPHEAVIHQYMREMIIKSGDMSIVSDSHTRYGTQGSLSIGEGGPELVKTMLGKGYDLKYPKVVGVFLTGKPKPWVGPMDIALTLIGSTFKNNFVKDAVLEFIGPGVGALSMDTRNGIDTMTTESACLSSVWMTDDQTKRYFEIHGRPEAYRAIRPGEIALYDKLIEIDLSLIEPMIAMPFHPSNVYKLSEVIANPTVVIEEVEENAKKVFENNPNIFFELRSKVRDGKFYIDQGVVAGCAAGSFENIYLMSCMAERAGRGLGTFNLNIYPASQPIMFELGRIGALNQLMKYGTKIKSAFCGPCFGAGDTPGNNDFSIRHTTRNFPNREGSNPLTGQVASVALMDARSIAAAAFNGGVLTHPERFWGAFEIPEYQFNTEIYDNIVYNGFGKASPQSELIYGPDIRDWPEMQPLTDHLLLQVASVIRDEVTTTDELIPSGETASYRSNPYKIAQFTLIRKDPDYVKNASEIQAFEKARLEGETQKVEAFYRVLREIGVETPVEALMATTGIGSLLYAKRPGDGSAREYAASCQKVLGGLANLCIEFATKRYRSNCVNWGILPLTTKEDPIDLMPGDYVYLPNIRAAVENGDQSVAAVIVSKAGTKRITQFNLDQVTENERGVLLAGSLINSYKA